MRGILVKANGDYSLLDIESINKLYNHIGGFICCSRPIASYLDGRLPKGICLIHKDLKTYREYLEVNEYATSLINMKNKIQNYIFGTVFIINETLEGERNFCDLDEDTIEVIIKSLELRREA